MQDKIFFALQMFNFWYIERLLKYPVQYSGKISTQVTPRNNESVIDMERVINTYN